MIHIIKSTALQLRLVYEYTLAMTNLIIREQSKSTVHQRERRVLHITKHPVIRNKYVTIAVTNLNAVRYNMS